MTDGRFLRSEISDSGLSFLLETTAPGVSDRLHMKEVLESNMEFRSAFLTEFQKALKPLTYIADHDLRHRRGLLLG